MAEFCITYCANFIKRRNRPDGNIMLTFGNGLLALLFLQGLHPIVTRFLGRELYLDVMKRKSSPPHFSIILGALAIVGVTLVGVTAGARAQGSDASPVVVELFTSQGCSSCPPADAFLRELATREDLIALTFPIDYWDNLGWPDTFANRAHTSRQRTYAKRLPNLRVYTPQMVVNGHLDIVGSHKQEVLDAIDAEANARQSFVDIDLVFQGNTLTITLGQAPFDRPNVRADVWIVPFHEGTQSVSIKAGENQGRTIDYANVVDGLMKLGQYQGRRTAYQHSLQVLIDKSITGCVVLVQEENNGSIIGARRIFLDTAL